MVEKNWMVAKWDDLKNLPETGPMEPISPRGKLIIDENSRVEWEYEHGETSVMAFYKDVPVAFGAIVDEIAIVYCSPVGNAVYGHGCKKRGEEMIATLQSAFRRYRKKKKMIPATENLQARPKRSAQRKPAEESKDQVLSLETKKGIKKPGWSKEKKKSSRPNYQVQRHWREAHWRNNANGTRSFVKGCWVRGHWCGKDSKELNAALDS